MKTNIKKIGYKASCHGKCKDLIYRVGRTYTKPKPASMCQYGYHYCKKIDDVFEYYPYKKGVTKIFEIEDLGCGETDGDKSVTNKIKIVREIPLSEWNGLMTKRRFDDRGNVIWESYENDETTTFEYDDAGNVTKITQADGSWEVYEYDERGNVTLESTSDGLWDRHEYDANNNITKTTNSNGTWDSWEFDSNNNMTRCEDSEGVWCTWTYDKRDREVTYKTSTGYWVEYTYTITGRQNKTFGYEIVV